jgi:ABC-type uncharacterized transport system auxiliary subunit
MSRSRWVTSTLLILLLEACAATAPVPDDHYYRLLASRTPLPGDSAPVTGVLKVDPVKAFGIYRERALLYTLESRPEQLQQHRYHYWIDTPSQLIREHLIEFLRSYRVAEQIVGSQLAVTADLRLKLTLKQFERVVSPSAADSVRVALDAVIVDADGRPLKIVSYHREKIATEASISVSVNAINQALGEIYLEIVKDLRTLSIGR